MCGLAGAYHFGRDAPVDADGLVRMRDAMEHRGPDGAGLWVSDDRRVGLAHRRLSIVDPTPEADQPMAGEDGMVRVVFNGEIYNHRSLRSELERRGHRFRTDHSDTEAIVHAWEEWGPDAVARLHGMFAFAVWDGRTDELTLVRDRIGIKPMYYTIAGGRLLFASEIKALLRDPGVRRAVDPTSLYHYLTFLATPAPRTLFDGIRKLPGGCMVTVGRDGPGLVERYWNVWDDGPDLAGASDGEIAGLLLAELGESVEARRMADVPVGVFLSGGIDSSTNATLFARADEPVKTFAIGYDRDWPGYQNEFRFARRVATDIGAEHHERRLTPDDVIDIMPLITAHQDEPIADPVCVPVYYVSELARRNGVVVAQVGEGADELFWGYPDWKRMLRLQQAAGLPVPRLAKRAGLGALRGLGRDQGLPYEWLRRDVSGRPVFWGGAEAFTERQKRALLSPELVRDAGVASSWDALRPIRERFLEGAPRPDNPLDWMSYLDLNLRLPELLLMRVDKMSMAVSLEARVPFLDHRFVELAMAIPQAVKTRGGELKHILKRAVRGLIPDAIIDRPKQGFGVPVHDWLGGRLGQEMRTKVDRLADQTGWLDPGAVPGLMRKTHGANQWVLYNLALWWEANLE